MGWREQSAGGNKFVNFKSGPYTGKFISGEDSENKWGKCTKLTFEDNGGNTQTYETSSKRLLGMLANVPYGTVIKISRFGVSTETTYEIDVIAKADVDALVKTVADDKMVESTIKSISGTVVNEPTDW